MQFRCIILSQYFPAFCGACNGDGVISSRLRCLTFSRIAVSRSFWVAARLVDRIEGQAR